MRTYSCTRTDEQLFTWLLLHLPFTRTKIVVACGDGHDDDFGGAGEDEDDDSDHDNKGHHQYDDG